MRALGLCVALVAGLAATPGSADPRIAGDTLLTASHGQPFCTSKRELLALLHAQISEAPIGYGEFPGCIYVADGAPVTVLADLSPGTRYLHVVYARTSAPFRGAIAGYTFSAGLSRYDIVPRTDPFHLF